MATKKVETADVKPKVTRAKAPKAETAEKRFKKWEYSNKWIVCPNCGKESRVETIEALGRCPVCGQRAE